MAGTRQNIDSWAKHHESKWRRVPVTTEWKVPVPRGRTFLGLTPALMDGGEGKRSFSRVGFDGVKDDQSSKRKLNEVNGWGTQPERQHKCSKVDGNGDRSSESKTIAKQGRVDHRRFSESTTTAKQFSAEGACSSRKKCHRAAMRDFAPVSQRPL